jgi:glycosyltransferase involved in cell wall biosynthesis
MQIGIYSPYLDTLGGGEKYILSAAQYLKKDSQVTVFWDDSSIVPKAEARFDLDLKDIDFVPNIFASKNPLKKFLNTRLFDSFIYVSDGSIPFLSSKNNIVLFQFPVPWIKSSSPIQKAKFKRINHFICYSEFVKKYLDKKFKTNTVVIPPPVYVEIKKVNKENIILSVGRFTKAMNTKKQEVLIDAFKKMCNTGLKGWKLILIGSYRSEDVDYFEDIKKRAAGFPIEVLGNISHDDLVSYYNKSKIYWHAAGFGEDLDKNPERAEHFGISTVEAMIVGCVPLVFNGGGQKEIVEDKKDGFLWDSTDELIDLTTKLIKNPDMLTNISSNASEISKRFSREVFEERIKKITSS